jgi:hypothetical protein
MWFFRFQNCFSPTPLMSTMLLLCEIGVSGCLRSMAEHRGMTKRVSDSYRANRRRFLVETLGEVMVALARFFS